MSDVLNVLVMGGHTKGFHEFGVMGPIYERFLTDAGFKVTLTEDRDDFRKEKLGPYQVIVDYTTGEDLTPEQAREFVAKTQASVRIRLPRLTTLNADAYSTRLSGVESNINVVVTWNVADWTLTK